MNIPTLCFIIVLFIIGITIGWAIVKVVHYSIVKNETIDNRTPEQTEQEIGMRYLIQDRKNRWHKEQGHVEHDNYMMIGKMMQYTGTSWRDKEGNNVTR